MLRGSRNLGLVFLAAPVWAEPVTIAALGDSLTAGYGLDTAEGFVPQMQNWLDENGVDAVMVNAGLSGDTSAGGLSRVDWTLTDEVDAMIVALGANDYLRGLDPDATRANIAGILDAAAARDVAVLLVGVPAGQNYGADYKERFDAIYPDLAGEYDTLHYESWFAGVMEASERQAAATRYMQGDNLHPNAEGVALIVAAMGPAVAELVAAAAE